MDNWANSSMDQRNSYESDLANDIYKDKLKKEYKKEKDFYTSPKNEFEKANLTKVSNKKAIGKAIGKPYLDKATNKTVQKYSWNVIDEVTGKKIEIHWEEDSNGNRQNIKIKDIQAEARNNQQRARLLKEAKMEAKKIRQKIDIQSKNRRKR